LIHDVASLVFGNTMPQLENFEKMRLNYRLPFMYKTIRKFWSHSLSCAVGAQLIVQKSGLHEISHDAFFAALFHDIGKLLIIKIIDEVISSKN